MKKSIFLLLFVFQIASAQNSSGGTDESNISIPLYSLPTKSDDFDFNLEMVYNEDLISSKYLVNETGLGWSTNSLGVITKEQPKLDFPDNNLASHFYSFNIDGVVGGFTITKSTTGSYIVGFNTKTPQLNYVVKFQMKPNTPGIKDIGILFFEIIDENGIHYFFEEAESQDVTFNNINYAIKMNWLLTKVTDANNNILGTVTYVNQKVQLTTPLKTNGYAISSYDLKKVRELSAIGVGKMVFNYEISPNYINNNLVGTEPFKLINVEIENLFANKIKKFGFNYSNIPHFKFQSTRILNSIDEYGVNAVTNTYEGFISTRFTYNIYGNTVGTRIDLNGYRDYSSDKRDYFDMDYHPSTSIYPNLKTVPFYTNKPNNGKDYGSLKEVLYPSGKKVQYTFESDTFSSLPGDILPNDFFDFKNTQNFLSKKIQTYSFDNWIQENALTPVNSNFEIVAGNKYFVAYKPILNTTIPQNPSNLNPDLPIIYVVNQANELVKTYVASQLQYTEYEYGVKLDLAPGVYSFRIPNEFTRIQATVDLYSVEKTSAPYKYSYGGGLRLKKVSVYEGDKTVASKEKSYSYNVFNDVYTSSGILLTDSGGFLNGSVFYTNISIKNEITGELIENVFLNPLQKYSSSRTDTFINTIYQEGFLIESRLMNKNLKLYQKIINSYELKSLSPFTFFLTKNTRNFSEYLLTKTVTKSYFPDIKESIVEYEYSPFNLKVSKISNSIYKDNSIPQKLIKNFEYDETVKANSNKVVLKTQSEDLDSTRLWTKKYFYTHAESSFDEPPVSFTPNNYDDGTLKYTTLSKGIGSDEVDLFINSYGTTNSIHPTEVISRGKAPMFLVWGYNNTKQILTIENYDASTDNSLISSLVTSLQNYSNTNDETNMIKTMLAIQTKVPTKMVSGTTYKPLIGVSKTLDPQGNTTSFEYDSFGRLEFVKDFNGNIIKEYKFNLRIK
jgi:hypothetical protein